jgi:nicotinate phosphoribosyltransferase
VGGRKWARRRIEQGIATAEVLGLVGATIPADHPADLRPLQIPLITAGRVESPATVDDLEAARERHRRSRAELPVTARQLSHGEPAVPTVWTGPPGSESSRPGTKSE